jgi:hypothetical protein
MQGSSCVGKEPIVRYVVEPGTQVEQVRHYTAPVKGSSSDDCASPQRQQRYLRALKTYRGSRIEIIQGFIMRTTPLLRLTNPSQVRSPAATVQVFQFTEKADGRQSHR